MESVFVEFVWEIYMYDCFILSEKLFTAMGELPNLSSVCCKSFEKWKDDGIHFRRIYASFKRSAPCATSISKCISVSLCICIGLTELEPVIHSNRFKKKIEKEGRSREKTKLPVRKNKSGNYVIVGSLHSIEKFIVTIFGAGKHEWMSDSSQLRRTKANCFQLNLISVPLCVRSRCTWFSIKMQNITFLAALLPYYIEINNEFQFKIKMWGKNYAVTLVLSLFSR